MKKLVVLIGMLAVFTCGTSARATLINFDSAGQTLDVNTSGGSITLDKIAGSVKAETSGGSISANITKLSDKLDLETSGGGIRVTGDLIDSLGEQYRTYRRRVPMLIPFTGATIHFAEAPAPPIEPLPISISERVENPGQTRLVLNLGAANLDLASLRFETTEPLFMRKVTVAVPQVSENAIHEQTLTQGVIFRVEVDGQPAILARHVS